MDVFCVGMHRAGSTWQYQVAGALVERHRAGRRLGFVTGAAYRGPIDGSWRALKSHDGHATFAAALQSGHALALHSYRDLRDVAYSLAHKFGLSFEEFARRGILAPVLENDRFWRAQPGVLHQRYESIVADPEEGIAAIADHLKFALADGEARALAAEFSKEANRGRTERLAAQLVAQGVDLARRENALWTDPETLLHWNHIRGDRGRPWAELATPEHRAYLAHACGAWLIEHGYEADDSWAS
ncbi:MAG TPA: hypothetical protein VG406_16860 [Isosphaeraceae bacterium]|jgi:hypothetical protein|nr:hypothetical protein [Isosphaeraceae bacterium]